MGIFFRSGKRCACAVFFVLGEKSSWSFRARGKQALSRVVLFAARSGTAAMKPLWGLGLLCVLLLAGEWGRGFSNLPRAAVEGWRLWDTPQVGLADFSPCFSWLEEICLRQPFKFPFVPLPGMGGSATRHSPYNHKKHTLRFEGCVTPPSKDWPPCFGKSYPDLDIPCRRNFTLQLHAHNTGLHGSFLVSF